LLAPIVPGERAVRWLYGGLSATLWLNLVWVDPAHPLPQVAGQLGWGMPVALVNMGALALTAGVMAGWARGSAARKGPTGP
jgi:hypothetical protein